MSITCEFVKMESNPSISEKLKCGDIYIRTTGVFSLTCGFCEWLEFFTLDSYSDHFNCHMQKEKHHTNIKLEHPTSSQDISLGNLVCDVEAGSSQEEDPLRNGASQPINKPLPQGVKDEHIISDSESDNKLVKLSPPARDLCEELGKEPYSCEYCSAKTKRKKQLLAHLWKVHSIGVSCRYCHKQLSTEFSRKEHEKIHTGHPSFVNRPPCTCCEPNCTNHKHVCDICNAGLTSKIGLKKHKWRVHLVGVSCRLCNKQFASEQTRDAHERNHTDTSGSKPIRNIQIRPCYCRKPKCPKHKRRAPPIRKRFKCKHCDEEFVYSIEFRKHSWTTHNIGTKCRFCDRQFYDRGNLNVHERTHTGELPFQCTYCSRAFNTSTTLKIHIMAHHEDNRPLLCTLCGKRFINNQKLNLHTKECHTTDIIYTCTLCDATFDTRQRLYRHRRSIHNNHKNMVLTCDICKRQFNTRKYLVQHMNIHTGQKLYKCRYCDLSFAQAAGKRGHERSKHEDIAISA